MQGVFRYFELLCRPLWLLLKQGEASLHGYGDIYDYITKISRQQAEVIQNYENENVRNIGQGEARHRKYKRLKLGGGQAYDRSSD
jgi:hypothetical protein